MDIVSHDMRKVTILFERTTAYMLRIKMLNRNKNIIVADLQSSEKAIEEARKSTKQQLRAIEGLEIILGSS